MWASCSIFGCLLLLTSVGRADILHPDWPQAFAGRFSVNFLQALTAWNKTFRLSVAIHFRYPFIPEMLRRTLFSSMHNLSHSGANTSIWLMTDLYGCQWKLTFDSGQKPMCHVRRPKWEDISAHLLDLFHHPMSSLPMYMKTSQDHYLCVRLSHIYWHVLIVSPTGMKLFPWRISMSLTQQRLLL